MAGITITRDVEAPAEVVFDLATDFPHLAEWIQAIDKIEVLTDGPIGVGTRFRETRTMFKREATEEMEVTAFERPEHIALFAESHGCRYRTDYQFRPTEDGKGTQIELRFQAEPRTLVAKVMAFVMRPMTKLILNECGKDLDDVKAAAEARA